MLTNCTEKEQLNHTEFMDLIPHLPIEDLLLTEYKIDSRWRKLLQLRDANKKLYHCSVCNVVRSGEKNLYAHIDGKKHKRSAVQLYHPKYTYSKENVQSAVSSIEKEQNCLKVSNTTDFISNGEGNQEQIMSSAVISTTITKTKSSLKQTVLEENDDRSSVILIGDDKDYNIHFATDEGLKAADNCEPTSKKRKIVVNPAAVTAKMDDLVTRNSKAKYQSNITILPKKIMRKKKALHSRNSNIEFFSTKTFSFNPLDDGIIGLIGVEYVVKILKNVNDNHPKYECGLCEFTSDGLRMQNHLISFSHRLKFCEKHFPTAIRQYQQYVHNIPTNETYKVMKSILNKLAIAIEEHHGRELPYECFENTFNINRHEILSNVFSCRHASEQYGPTFTHIVDAKEVDKLAAELDKYEPPTNFVENIVFELRKNTCYKLHDNNHKRNYIPHRFGVQPENSQRHRNRNTETINHESHNLIVEDFLENTCQNRSSQSCSNFSQDQPNSESEHNVWQTYCHLLYQKINDLDELFEIYRADPETHPRYDQEWQIFWKRRKNELIEMGLDHRTYNYQPEWVKFFNIRIEELYLRAVEDIKIETRKRLSLPIINESLEDEKYFIYSMNNPKDIIVSNIIAQKYPKEETPENFIYSENLKVVSLLRLLTGLEEYLGSLGPKIVKLLSKALQVAKNVPESLNSVILNEENVSLLETAKEKFKGLIIAGILDASRQRVLGKAIDEVELLLSNKNNLSLHKTSLQIKGNNAKKNHLVTNILTQVDKNEVAFKLAGLLSAQGKTDVDPVQLQKIISVYMLIEEKKQQSSIKSKYDFNQSDRFKDNTSIWDNITFNENENCNFSNNYRENIGSNYQLPKHIRQNASLNKTKKK